ncbi:MAG: MFS transporter [Rhizobiaceae bacterium]|nr:MFS transporter [Rhizobiaceae bacterium]
MGAFFSFFKENSRWILGGFLMTFCSSFGQTFFIALSGKEIRAEYGLSNGEFGGIYMLATLGSAMVLPQVGKLVDVISVSRTVLIIAPMLAFACVSMAFSDSLYLLLLTLFGLRLFGQGMMTHTAMTAIGRWFAGHRGRAVSTVALGHSAGETIFPLIFVIISLTIGWRNTWLAGAFFLIVIALPLIFGLMRVERQPRSSDKPAVASSARDWKRGEVMRDGLFWLMALGVFAPAFIGTSVFFHQAYLVGIRGWTQQFFAGSFVIMSVVAICSGLISGQLVDRFSATRILPFFLLPLGIACLFLGLIESRIGLLLYMALLGVSYGTSTTLFGALWPEIYGTKHLGSVRSIIVALMVLSSALGPGITGYLIDYGIPFPSQIIVMGFYCLAVSVVMLFVSRQVANRQRAELAAY